MAFGNVPTGLACVIEVTIAPESTLSGVSPSTSPEVVNVRAGTAAPYTFVRSFAVTVSGARVTVNVAGANVRV